MAVAPDFIGFPPQLQSTPNVKAIVAGASGFSVDGSGNVIATLPTADPAVVGALWSDSGVVTVSAG